MVGAGIGEWVSDYLDVCFATPRWETRGIWSQVLRRSFAHLTSLPLAHGDSLLQFERLVEERDYVECMHHLAEFAGNLARKYGFHRSSHPADEPGMHQYVTGSDSLCVAAMAIVPRARR